jgi:hypothetical protein
MSSFTEKTLKGDVVRITGQYGTFITGDLFINNQQVSPGSMELADGSVTTAKLAASAVTGPKLAALSVDPSKIVDNAITSSKILNSAVTQDKLANNSVSYGKIQQVSTGNRVLGSTTNNGAVAEVQIATGMIADNAVSYGKIQQVSTGNRVLGSTTNNGAVEEVQVATGMIADNAVTAGKLATALQPSHVVKHAGILTTAGTGTTEDFTINGVLISDLLFTQMVNGTTVISNARISAINTIQIDFSGNSAGQTVNYQVLRAV